MKVYTKIVISLVTDQVIEASSYEYEGPVAHCGGGGSSPSVKQPIAGQIVRQLWRGNQPNTPFGNRLNSIVSLNENDPYRDMAVKRLTNDVNAQYGARGLATSGIGLKGVTEAITNFDVNREEQKANQAIQILGTASSGGTPQQGSQPRGLFGLK